MGLRRLTILARIIIALGSMIILTVVVDNETLSVLLAESEYPREVAGSEAVEDEGEVSCLLGFEPVLVVDAPERQVLRDNSGDWHQH